MRNFQFRSRIPGHTTATAVLVWLAMVPCLVRPAWPECRDVRFFFARSDVFAPQSRSGQAIPSVDIPTMDRACPSTQDAGRFGGGHPSARLWQVDDRPPTHNRFTFGKSGS
jgi:hypothetical protein